MKKYVLDLKVTSTTRPHERYVLLKLTHENPLPEMLSGQFAELKVDGSPSTFCVDLFLLIISIVNEMRFGS